MNDEGHDWFATQRPDVALQQAYRTGVLVLVARLHPVPRPAPSGRGGGPEVEAYLIYLASGRGLSPSSHRQALSALLFLYGKVLGLQLPWMQEIGRPVPRRRLPVGLSVDEVLSALAKLQGEHQLLARLPELEGQDIYIQGMLSFGFEEVCIRHFPAAERADGYRSLMSGAAVR